MPSAVVRLLCESRSQSRTVRDAATGERPFYWRGSSVKFQLALADQGSFLTAAGVGEIIVEVKALGASSLDDSLMRKVFLAGDCDETFVAADWAGGIKQLLEATFTVNEAAILPGSYRLIVRHVDGDGEENTYLSSELAVLDPQSGSEGIDPPPIAWDYLDGVPVVRYDGPQPLLPAERETARANIGISLSSGGFGAADSGKALTFSAEGAAAATLYFILRDPIDGNAELGLQAYNSVQTIYAINNGWSMNLQFPLLTATRYLTFPDRTGTIATLSGNQAFTGQLTAPNQTAGTSDSLMTRNLGDARYDRPFVLSDTTGTQAPSTAWVNSATQITLPAGTYVYEGMVGVSTASSTAGSNVQLTSFTGTGVMRTMVYRGTDFYALNTLNNHYLRADANVPYLAALAIDPSASAKYGLGFMQGRIVLASQQTFGFALSQRTTTDAANPSVLMPGSYLSFRKIA